MAPAMGAGPGSRAAEVITGQSLQGSRGGPHFRLPFTGGTYNLGLGGFPYPGNSTSVPVDLKPGVQLPLEIF